MEIYKHSRNCLLWYRRKSLNLQLARKILLLIAILQLQEHKEEKLMELARLLIKNNHKSKSSLLLEAVSKLIF